MNSDRGRASPGLGLPGAVGNAVVHGGQVGQVEHVAHQGAALGAHLAFHMVVFAEREVHRDGLAAGAHFQFHVTVVQQQLESLQVVRVVQVGARQRGLEPAWARPTKP